MKIKDALWEKLVVRSLCPFSSLIVFCVAWLAFPFFFQPSGGLGVYAAELGYSDFAIVVLAWIAWTLSAKIYSDSITITEEGLGVDTHRIWSCTSIHVGFVTLVSVRLSKPMVAWLFFAPKSAIRFIEKGSNSKINRYFERRVSVIKLTKEGMEIATSASYITTSSDGELLFTHNPGITVANFANNYSFVNSDGGMFNNNVFIKLIHNYVKGNQQ